MHDNNNYVTHIRALKQALDHGLILEKLHRVIQFNWQAWLKLYKDVNIELRTKAKNDFEKNLLKLMNYSVFGKTMKNVGKHRDIKIVITNRRRNQLVSEPNYHTTKQFSENLLATEMNKTGVKMEKPLYLGLWILEISKIAVYEYWYDYRKLKYGDKAKLCHTSMQPLPEMLKKIWYFKLLSREITANSKTKNVIELLKDELSEEVMKEIAVLRPKMYTYITDNDHVEKKNTKKHIVKREIKFQHYQECLETNKTIIISQ